MTEVLDRLRKSLADRYTIERELGQGGMATVYLANDLKHERQVALKVLKPELAAVLGADRFVVEIKTTASLSHPHILPLFDSGTADGFLFYVMPFIQGETLRDKLNRETQFGVDEAVKIAVEVADALDYAHRSGVIHRDIKPENILLHDGRPMVADFGIALALSAAAGGRMTETGLSLGTPHYMSPEQATAEKEITGRSDVYSLASVLYEMLTGEPPHMGKSAQQIIMKIIAEPVQPVTELRKTVPEHVADAVAQALEKLPADRFASAAAFAAALQGKVAGRTTTRAAAVAGRSSKWRVAALAATGAAVLFGALAAWGWLKAPERPVVRVSMAFPASARLTAAATRRLDISRDGSRIVYVGPDSLGSQLWVRELNALEARPLGGTRGAQAPFFAPDGQHVGFITGNPGDIRSVAVAGGPSQVLVKDSASAWGADWADDGFVYFVHASTRLARVPASGGDVEVLSVLDTARGETEHDWPQRISGGKYVLVQVWHSSPADAELAVVDLETGRSRSVVQALYGRYLPAGYLAYATFDGTLRAAPFDPKKGELTGAAVTIAENVQVDGLSGSGQFAVSRNGTLIYSPGGGAGGEQVVWVDRAGRMTPVDSSWRGQFSAVALSPDGTRIAVAQVSTEGEQIWVKSVPRGPFTRLTFGAFSNSRPSWHPDGRRIAFVRAGTNSRGIWWLRADGSSPAESLWVHPKTVDEISWAPDGRSAAVRLGSGGTRTRDIFAVTPGGDTTMRGIATGSPDEFAPAISPNGRWIAYVSNEAGRPEVFVRRLDSPDAGRTQVSVDGGEEPRWARSGRELFYRSGRGDMLVSELEPGNEFRVKSRRLLWNRPNLGSDQYHTSYDISLDDQRFLMVNRSLSEVPEVVMVLNWFEELRRRRTP